MTVSAINSFFSPAERAYRRKRFDSDNIVAPGRNTRVYTLAISSVELYERRRRIAINKYELHSAICIARYFIPACGWNEAERNRPAFSKVRSNICAMHDSAFSPSFDFQTKWWRQRTDPRTNAARPDGGARAPAACTIFSLVYIPRRSRKKYSRPQRLVEFSALPFFAAVEFHVWGKSALPIVIVSGKSGIVLKHRATFREIRLFQSI